MKRSSALAVLQIEVGINPFHEDLEEVEGWKFHEEVLDAPFFVIFILFIHFRFRDYVLWIRSIIYKIIHCFDQVLLVFQIVK